MNQQIEYLKALDLTVWVSNKKEAAVEAARFHCLLAKQSYDAHQALLSNILQALKWPEDQTNIVFDDINQLGGIEQGLCVVFGENLALNSDLHRPNLIVVNSLEDMVQNRMAKKQTWDKLKQYSL